MQHVKNVRRGQTLAAQGRVTSLLLLLPTRRGAHCHDGLVLPRLRTRPAGSQSFRCDVGCHSIAYGVRDWPLPRNSGLRIVRRMQAGTQLHHPGSDIRPRSRSYDFDGTASVCLTQGAARPASLEVTDVRETIMRDVGTDHVPGPNLSVLWQAQKHFRTARKVYLPSVPADCEQSVEVRH